MRILITNKTSHTGFEKSFFNALIGAVKRFTEIPKNSELSLLLTGDEEIRKLNLTYRGKDKPTDVLSFPLGENGMLGDIVISLETAERQSNGSFREETGYLFIHGILHLLGFEHGEEDLSAPMFDLQQRVYEEWAAKSEPYYSVKMRASLQGVHISGAERIEGAKENLAEGARALINRALTHPKGAPDFINIKVERIPHGEIRRLKALPVSVIETSAAGLGREKACALLLKLGVGLGEGGKLLKTLTSATCLRGARILDADTLEERILDQKTCVRVTYMDSSLPALEGKKNHFREALILASKVARAPGIVAEYCVSDDPEYVTGYVAAESGYRRILTLKEKGDPTGGRIFFFRGDEKLLKKCVAYLERTPVIVEDLPLLPKPPKERELRGALEEKRRQNLLRKIPDGKTRELAVFASNNYLGLARARAVTAAAALAAKVYGAGTGGSRLLTGNTPVHEALEKELAQFKKRPAALVFNTGYMANIGIISSLCDEGWVIFSDEKNHASIIDGCRLSKAKTVVYGHRDIEDLEEKAYAYRERRGLIVTDAVFSMEGDIAPLPEICRIASKHDFYTMVDEAHSTGVLGKTGRGIEEHFGDTARADILMGTLSKALGSAGGFLCGSPVLIEYCLNHARSFIFSTALPSGQAAAALAALKILRNSPARVEKLRSNVKYFLSELEKRGVKTVSESAIIPIFIGEEKRALAASKKLEERGFYVLPVRYPTVKKGEAILRVTLSALHKQGELRELAQLLADYLKGSG